MAPRLMCVVYAHIVFPSVVGFGNVVVRTCSVAKSAIFVSSTICATLWKRNIEKITVEDAKVLINEA